MNAKRIVAASAALLLIGLTSSAAKTSRSLTLRDGSKLTLLAVTYGTNHAAPYNQVFPQWKGDSAEHTDKNELILWFKQENTTNTYNDYHVYFYDKSNAVCVRQFESTFEDLDPVNYSMAWYPGKPPIPSNQNRSNFCSFCFEAFPRRDRTFIARIKQWDRSIPFPGPNEIDVGEFVISNPVHGPFRRWTANPLPETKRAGDLSVTLTRLVPDVPLLWPPRSPAPKDPINCGALAGFRLTQAGQAVTNWRPGGIEIWDATGNHTFGDCGFRWTNGEVSAVYPGQLWNDGSAWKLRAEFYQVADYETGELCTVTNLPVHAGRAEDMIIENAHLTHDPVVKVVNGVELKFFPARRFTDVGAKGDPQGCLWVETKPEELELNGVRLSLVKITNELGREIKMDPEHSSFIKSRLHNLGESKSLNVTLAVHRSRFVEFVAKPAQ